MGHTFTRAWEMSYHRLAQFCRACLLLATPLARVGRVRCMTMAAIPATAPFLPSVSRSRIGEGPWCRASLASASGVGGVWTVWLPNVRAVPWTYHCTAEAQWQQQGWCRILLLGFSCRHKVVHCEHLLQLLTVAVSTAAHILPGAACCHGLKCPDLMYGKFHVSRFKLQSQACGAFPILMLMSDKRNVSD